MRELLREWRGRQGTGYGEEREGTVYSAGSSGGKKGKQGQRSADLCETGEHREATAKNSSTSWGTKEYMAASKMNRAKIWKETSDKKGL